MQRAGILRAFAGAGSAAFGAIVLLALSSLPEAPSSLDGEVRVSLGRSGVEHPVTAVLLAFRAWDTWLEVAVLLVAVVGASLLTQTEGVGKAEPQRSAEQPLIWLIWLVVPGLVLLAGHVLLQGTTGPGGAFQTGALLAAGAVLLELGGYSTVGRLHPLVLRALWAAGIAAFLLAAVVGLARGRVLLELPLAVAGAWILCIEAAVSVAIGTGLVSLFLAARAAGQES